MGNRKPRKPRIVKLPQCQLCEQNGSGNEYDGPYHCQVCHRIVCYNCSQEHLQGFDEYPYIGGAERLCKFCFENGTTYLEIEKAMMDHFIEEIDRLYDEWKNDMLEKLTSALH
jgi:hypothetical protein